MLRTGRTSRRFCPLSNLGMRWRALWRRWSLASFALSAGWLHDWFPAVFGKRVTGPVQFPKAKLTFEILERREFCNDPFGMLQAHAFQVLAFAGLDALGDRGLDRPAWVRSPGHEEDQAWAASLLARMETKVSDLPELPPGSGGGAAVDPHLGTGWAPVGEPLSPWTGSGQDLFGDPLGGGSMPSGGFNASGPLGLSNLIVNPFSTAPPTFGGGGGATGSASTSSAPGSASGAGGSSDGGTFGAVSAASAASAAASASPRTATPPAISVAPVATPTRAAASTTAVLAQQYAKLPMVFEPNMGQTDPQVQYLARGGGYTLFLTNSEAVLTLARPNGPATAATPRRDVIRMEFEGANQNVQVIGQNDLESRSNYFTTSDASQGITDIPNYGQVSYKNLYSGISALFYGNTQRQLEYDFIVAPGADPHQIQISLTGSTSVETDSQGNLLVKTANGQLIEQAPKLYQMVNGVKQPVSGGYVLLVPLPEFPVTLAA